jgi:hypothetical protein
MYRLYRLDRFPDWVRFRLYRETYFVKSDTAIRDAFDSLLARLARPVSGPINHLEQLSDVQAALNRSADREVFSRMVFPQAQAGQTLEILAVGGSEKRHVIVRSQILDKHGKSYVVRDPLSPSEIGLLYRLFLDSGYPNPVYEREKYLVAVDEQERVIAGVCYRAQDSTTVYLDGLVVTTSMTGRGLAGAILEDLCVRLAAEGIRILKTNFFLRRFYSRHQFRVDARWGGLVRFLGTENNHRRSPESAEK